MKVKQLLFMLICVFIINACTFGIPIGRHGKISVGVSSDGAKKNRGNPSSYIVFGKRYYVMKNADGFVERGVASWYGTKFHGRKTSNGETYNMYAMTAAHKNLPLPSYVHVKNLDNDRSMVVRVNDRGPFVEGRIIDLSYAAAKKLGVDIPGTARVEISVVQRGQRTPVKKATRAIPLKESSSSNVVEAPLFIQMGSFSSQLNANNLMHDLVDANESSAKISQLKTSKGLFYRVRLGPLFDINEANEAVRRLKNKGFQTSRIVVQDDGDKP